MGTRKIGTLILETLQGGPRTYSEIKRELSANGLKVSSEELDKTLARLGRLGFLQVKNEKPAELYLLTALGQAVSDNPKK